MARVSIGSPTGGGAGAAGDDIDAAGCADAAGGDGDVAAGGDADGVGGGGLPVSVGVDVAVEGRRDTEGAGDVAGTAAIEGGEESGPGVAA